MQVPVFLLVLGVAIAEAVGQTLVYKSAKSAKQHSYVFFILAWLSYLAVLYFLTKTYQFKGVGFVTVLWSGLTCLLMLIIGYVMFGERLTMREWIGAAFVLLGVLVMNWQKAAQHFRLPIH